MCSISLISVVLWMVCTVQMSDALRVTTDLGDIVGNEVVIKIAGIDFTVNTFFGIPYAKPPIGDFRFKKPEPIERYGEPVNADVAGPACIQRQTGTRQINMAEDCLTLNIFTPDITGNVSASHAVMIYIHGGGFDTGAGSDFIGTNLVLSGNVIVVTLNYRLGFFGFMSTGDAHAPGNLGLWDQRLAIKWVHDHIDKFGGDKSRVILFGQSAGGTSVLYQSLNLQNEGLFHGVISQSMSSFRWNIDSEPQAKASRVAGALNCDMASTQSMVNCLRRQNAQDIMTAISDLVQTDQTPYDLRFVPRIDNDFIKFNPIDLTSLNLPASRGILEFFRSLCFLGGFNSAEGALYTSLWPEFGDPETFEPTRSKIDDELIPKSLNLFYSKNYNEALKQQVIAEYTDWTFPDSPQLLRQEIVKLIGDLEFGVPTMELGLIHAGVSGLDNNKTFVYYFASPPEKIAIFPRPSWVTGANHADELLFLIGLPNPSNWEYILMSSMMTYWSNFAKSGNPNAPSQATKPWPSFTASLQETIVLDNQLTLNGTKRYFYAEETNFWLVAVPITEKLTSAEACRQTSGGPTRIPAHWVTPLMVLLDIFVLAFVAM